MGRQGTRPQWPVAAAARGLALCAWGLLLLAPGPAPAGDRTFVGTVIRVGSGDTMVVRAGGRDRPVRLLGIDAPAAGEAFGALARARTAALAVGNPVTVLPVREDPRGRTVAVVRLPDGRDLGLALLTAGLCRWDRLGAPDARGLAAAEAEARAAGRGLWRGPGERGPPRP